MKIVVFADEEIRQKVTSSLAGEGVGIVCASDGAEAMKLLRQERFDLALVDSLMEGVEVACSCISKFFGVPVVLLVRQVDVDWKRLHSLEPHGYILEGAGGVEVAARLWAIVRRLSEQTLNNGDRGWKA